MNSLGIDIKEDSVAILYLKSSFKGLNIAARSVYALEKDRALKDNLNIVRELITDFMQENHVNGSSTIFIGIPGNLAIFKTIEFPTAVKENLRSTLRYEMEKYVPIPIDDILFDYQILSEDKTKKRIKILLAVGKKTAIMPYLDFSDTLKGGVSGIEPDSTGFANFIAYDKKIRSFKSDKELFEALRSNAKSWEPNRITDIFNVFVTAEFVTAYGLALKGLSDVPLKINLLPPESQKKPGRAGYYMMIILIILAILSGIGWGGSHILRQKLILKELNEEMKHLTAEVKNIDRIQSSFKELEDRLDYLNNLQQNRVSGLNILREMTQLIPETAWIQDLSFSEKGIQISGYAASASELIPILEDSPLFKDVVFLSTITKEKDGKERFRIGLKLENS